MTLAAGPPEAGTHARSRLRPVRETRSRPLDPAAAPLSPTRPRLPSAASGRTALPSAGPAVSNRVCGVWRERRVRWLRSAAADPEDVVQVVSCAPAGEALVVDKVEWVLLGEGDGWCREAVQANFLGKD